MTKTKWIRRLALPGAVLIMSTACQELEMDNPNNPDRVRALGEPSDIEALIGGTFNVYFDIVHNSATVVRFAPFGPVLTAAGGAFQVVSEPRQSLQNTASIGGAGPLGPRDNWRVLLQVASSVHDGLAAMDELRMNDPRLRAFAKFMQGTAWSTLAVLYDRVIVIPETEPYAVNAVAQGVAAMRPREDALNAALAAFDEAIAIASQSSFTYPAFPQSRLWFGAPRPMTSAEFGRLANTVAARMLVLSARTPEERKTKVNWNRVLQYTAKGLTTNETLEAALAAGFRSSLLITQLELSTAACDCFRLGYRLIGMADTSGRFQQWLKSPVEQRNRFDIVTPDRRITGATPTSNGTWVRYIANDNGFPANRGVYFRSAYQSARHFFRGFQAGNVGTAIMATGKENNLLRAEALLRTGDLAGAAALVNISRTNPDAGLPPVTANGVPQSADCAPRAELTGACGDLLVALRYERMLETLTYDSWRGYLEGRGSGMLPDFTAIQLPLPGNEAELLGLPISTFGGQGGEGSATYAPETLR